MCKDELRCSLCGLLETLGLAQLSEGLNGLRTLQRVHGELESSSLSAILFSTTPGGK
jgi:hypothetical protein